MKTYIQHISEALEFLENDNPCGAISSLRRAQKSTTGLDARKLAEKAEAEAELGSVTIAADLCRFAMDAARAATVPHTPGPWQYLTHDGSKTVGVARFNGYRSQEHICTIQRDNPNWRKDARLISASPELLAACEMAVASLTAAVERLTALGLTSDRAQTDPLLPVLVAAINKAKGKM